MKTSEIGMVRKFYNFHKDEHGSITAFLLVIFLLMVVAGGMAVDFMRHESERVVFQDVLDRAVLSTASFDSKFHTEEEIVDVIHSHLEAAGYDTDYLKDLKIYPTVTSSGRRVDVSANFEIRTFFLRIMNKPVLTLAARATAETKRGDLEMSLVVDVSGSMDRYPRTCEEVEGHWQTYRDRRGNMRTRWVDAYTNCYEDNSKPKKIDSLRKAATSFVESMLADDGDLANTSISIVPFSAQVEPGKAIADQFTGLNRWHNYSYCFEMDDNDFNTTAMAPNDNFEQGQSFHPGWRNDDTFRWCPRSANQITPLSNDFDTLSGAIDNLQVELYTSIWMGAKWGAALLDPSFQPVVNGLISTPNGSGGSVVHPSFVGRPESWNSDAAKYLIVMTDGDNTRHQTVEPGKFDVFNDQTNVGTWKTQRNADYWEGQQCDSNGLNCSEVANIWDRRINRDNLDNLPGYADGDREGDWLDIWNNTGGTHEGFGDTRLSNVCSAAKTENARGDHRIVIYTIGFDIMPDSLAATALLDCASDSRKFFLAQNEEDLLEAYDLIAASIQRLKLVVN